MNLSFKKFTLIFLAAFFVSGFSYLFLYKPDNVVVVQSEYPFDVEDRGLLVENTSNVFVGTVLDKLDTESDDVGIYTPYRVEVLEPLKGDFSIGSEISVSQRIGYDNIEKATIKASETDDYMEVGETYVFLVNYDPEGDTYRIVVPEYGNVKVKDEKEKSLNTAIVNDFKEKVKASKEKVTKE